jgi:hypothetical protein
VWNRPLCNLVLNKGLTQCFLGFLFLAFDELLLPEVLLLQPRLILEVTVLLFRERRPQRPPKWSVCAQPATDVVKLSCPL